MAFALAIHGGAGASPKLNYDVQAEHLDELIRLGGDRLASGAAALDVAVEMVMELERCGLYFAGKGAAPNSDGDYELDASVMDGPSLDAGGVAAIRGIIHPVAAARYVMQDTRHVMLAADGAGAFARAKHMQQVTDPDDYYCGKTGTGAHEDAVHGTVGAAVLDDQGRLAAATSTCGAINKMPGRVGDTPLIGAGTWADQQVAVSCTGHGEYFMRVCAAHDVAARMAYGGEGLAEAARNTLDKVASIGGDGGLIAVARDGGVVMPFNSEGMKCAAITSARAPAVHVFDRADDWV